MSRAMHTAEDTQRVSDAVTAAIHTHINNIGDKTRELKEDADELDKQVSQWKIELKTISQANERLDAVPHKGGAALNLGMFSERNLLHMLIASCRDKIQGIYASHTRHNRRTAGYYRRPEKSNR
jgi:chemotaxis regulatin CheY-phosphate phosphatase CheZ